MSCVVFKTIEDRMTMDRLIRRIDGFLGVYSPSNIKHSLKTKSLSESDVQALSGAYDADWISVGCSIRSKVDFIGTEDSGRFHLDVVQISPSFKLKSRDEWDVETEKTWYTAVRSSGDIYLSRIEEGEFYLKPWEDSPDSLIRVFCKA